MISLQPLMQSDRQDWNTPENILELVRRFDVIGLDPCCNDDATTDPITACYEALCDGLSYVWEGHGLVYVNPPYGRQIAPWLQKAARSLWTAGDHCIMLVPARTDTRWWQDAAPQADAVCFWKGRLTFQGAPAPAPFPSALLYFGRHSARFRHIFRTHGWIP